MWALAISLLSQVFGENGPIGQYLKIKSDTAKAEQNYKLEVLKAQSAQITQQLVSDTTDLSNRLQSTSQSFKQGTFYPLWALVIFSVLFPSKATEMWHNFGLIPEWFQWLFLSVYSAIWGLPFVKGGYGAFIEQLQSRREYKLNRQAIFNQVKASWFPKGMNDQQVKDLDNAIDKGENN